MKEAGAGLAGGMRGMQRWMWKNGTCTGTWSVMTGIRSCCAAHHHRKSSLQWPKLTKPYGFNHLHFFFVRCTRKIGKIHDLVSFGHWNELLSPPPLPTGVRLVPVSLYRPTVPRSPTRGPSRRGDDSGLTSLPTLFAV